MLQVSSGLQYSWDDTLPKGRKVVAGSIRINGLPMDESKTYRVVANNFLAEGADGFPMFAEATNKHDTHIVDLDAFIALLVKNEREGVSAGTASMAAPAASAAAAPRILRVK
jgi:5'-nucleotidase